MFDEQLNLPDRPGIDLGNTCNSTELGQGVEEQYLRPEFAGSDASAYDYLAQLCKEQVIRGETEAKVLPKINTVNRNHMDDKLEVFKHELHSAGKVTLDSAVRSNDDENYSEEE
jgi:hypothetical protein